MLCVDDNSIARVLGSVVSYGCLFCIAHVLSQ
jgi:hypothetical protein